MNALTVKTPIGPLTALTTSAGVRALGFTADPAELDDGDVELHHDRDLAARLGAYFDGELRAIDSIPLDLNGASDWRRTVWSRLRDVPPGETLTYAQLAAECGTGSARAAGSACAHNPLGLLIPCHRIVGSDGSLRGYAWGLERKRWLLEHEAGRL
jgi:methylated-DNA-[protein]-cysteine S-methyltransferase